MDNNQIKEKIKSYIMDQGAGRTWDSPPYPTTGAPFRRLSNPSSPGVKSLIVHGLQGAFQLPERKYAHRHDRQAEYHGIHGIR